MLLPAVSTASSRGSCHAVSPAVGLVWGEPLYFPDSDLLHSILLKQVQLGLSRIEREKEKSHAVPPHRTVKQPGVRGEQGLGLPSRWATGKALHEAKGFFKSVHSLAPNTTAKSLPFHLCGDTISNLTEFWQKQLAYELVINYLRQQGIEGANLHISRRNSGTKGKAACFNLPICSFLSGPPFHMHWAPCLPPGGAQGSLLSQPFPSAF